MATNSVLAASITVAGSIGSSSAQFINVADVSSKDNPSTFSFL
ncbi:hypothetical protein R8G64_01310 [Tenacibaculum maritimum]